MERLMGGICAPAWRSREEPGGAGRKLGMLAALAPTLTQQDGTLSMANDEETSPDVSVM